MTRLNLMLAVSISSLVLISCDTKDRTPITGKRETILSFSEDLVPDRSSKTPLGVSQGSVNASWSMPGGTPSHAQGPAALGKEPKQAWSTSIGSANSDDHRITSSPVVDQGRVYAVDGYGKLTGVDSKTGAVVWQFDSMPPEEKGEGMGGGVASYGNTVYMTNAYGEMIALNAADGKVKWRSKIGAPMRVGPTVVGDRLYAVTINNHVVAVSASSGKVIWTHRGLAESAGILGGSSPAVAGDKVIATLSSGEVVALNASNGQPVWHEVLSPSLGSDTVAGIAHIRARPVIEGDHVHVISHGGRMVALDLQTGEQRWSREISGIRSPALAAGHLFLVDTDGRLMAVNAHNGSLRWIEPLPMSSGGERIDWAGPVVAGGHLVLTGSHGKAVLASPDNGRVIKEIDLPSGSSQSPIVAGSTLYVLANDGQLAAYK